MRFSGLDKLDQITTFYEGIIHAFRSLNPDRIVNILQEAVEGLSARVLHKEHVYHLFIAGMFEVLNRTSICRCKTETGAGQGFADMIMHFDQDDQSIVIEFKKTDSFARAERTAHDGLLQIFEKSYIDAVPTNHKILAMSCVFARTKQITALAVLLNQGERPQRENLRDFLGSATYVEGIILDH